MVSDCVSQSKEIVSWCSNIPILHQCVMKVSVECLLNAGHIAKLWNSANGYLLTSLLVSFRLSRSHDKPPAAEKPMQKVY